MDRSRPGEKTKVWLPGKFLPRILGRAGPLLVPQNCPSTPKFCCPWPQALRSLGGKVGGGRERKKQNNSVISATASIFMMNASSDCTQHRRGRHISYKNHPPRTPSPPGCGQGPSASARLGMLPCLELTQGTPRDPRLWDRLYLKGREVKSSPMANGVAKDTSLPSLAAGNLGLDWL